MNLRILVTGSGGFLGTHVCNAIDRRRDLDLIRCDGRAVCDLRDPVATDNLLRSIEPDHVIHLAARVGGIGANMANPATFWHDNLAMGMNILKASRFLRKKLVLVGTTCSFPVTPKTIPFVESELFDGMPEPTNAPYGIAKRCLFCGAKAYRKQFGLQTAMLIPTNLYGSGDNFDPGTSHVIPALFRKMVEARNAGRDSVELWGTGRATRDFLYVEDCAEAIVKALDVDTGDEWVNLGSGQEVSIADLASMISKVVGYEGSFEWDLLKPDGQPRRCLDVRRAGELLGWWAMTPLDEGLKRTYESLAS